MGRNISEKDSSQQMNLLRLSKLESNIFQSATRNSFILARKKKKKKLLLSNLF